MGFGGDRRTGCGELAKGSESSASSGCLVGLLIVSVEGLPVYVEGSSWLCDANIGELVSSIGSEATEARPFPFVRTGGRIV